MTTEEMVALIKASRDWAKALPKHPHEDTIGAHLQDFFSLQDAFLLRAYAARPGAPPEARYSEIPGMVQGYWFGEHEEIPDAAPNYSPFAALLPPRVLVDLPPSLVLVRGLPDWITVSAAAAGTYKFSETFAVNGTAGVAQFAVWGKGIRTVRRVYFTTLEAERIGYLYGPEAGERCEHGQRVLVATDEIPTIVGRR